MTPPEPTLTLPVITSWDEWGRIFTDVRTWTPAVREIARRAGLPVTSIEAGYPGTNAVFIVNSPTSVGTGPPAYVVKIYCPFCAEDFILERTLHPLLMRYPELPVPAVLGQGVLRGEMDWPYLILSYLPGEAIRDVRAAIPTTNLVSIARELGRCAKILHGIPQSSFLSLEPLLGNWKTLAEQHLVKTLAQLGDQQVLPADLIEQIPGIVTAALNNHTPSDLVLINGDLTEDHVLLQQEGGEWHISGLIDFADSLVGPHEVEWVALWFGALGRDAACLAAFMQGYQPGFEVDETFYRRAMAFTFLHEFGAPMIEQALQALGAPQVESLDQLREYLWHATARDCQAWKRR
jgi:hygromycin-B 7''-O-kinase